jgi:ABC-type Na+ efflux pump permease subunit
MNWKDIRTLYLRELRSALRERGIVVYSIIIPVVLYPLLMWLVYTAFSYANGQAAELKSHVMVRTIPEAHQALRRALQEDRAIDVDFSETPQEDIKKGNLDLIIDFV